MKLLLDTHIVLWAAGQPEKLSESARTLLTIHILAFLQFLVFRLDSIIPAAVFEEVVNQDTIEKFPDAKSISVMTSQGNIEIFSKELPDRKPPLTLGKGEWAAIRLAQEMGEGAILATDDGKAIKTCRFLNLPFIISPKIATELYRHGCIEKPLAKAAIEKMRIEGQYAPDIIAEALLILKEMGNVETGNREDT